VPRPFLEIAAAREARAPPPSRKRDRSPAPAPATEAPAATPPPPPPGGPDVSLEALKSDAPKRDVSLAALLAKARAKAAK
jgi:hypothetical protein